MMNFSIHIISTLDGNFQLEVFGIENNVSGIQHNTSGKQLFLDGFISKFHSFKNRKKATDFLKVHLFLIQKQISVWII